jgi:DNA-binding transcriptional ArsR family regulator
VDTYSKVLVALSDPTRRALFEKLRARPRSVGELANELPVSQPAVSQHLRVLREAGLVECRAVGTKRVYRPSVDGVRALRSYVEMLWDDVLDAFKVAQDEAEGCRTGSGETGVESKGGNR